MNYHHLYHAGNFADVFKHIIVTALLKNLQRKEKAYCYLDTHAGAGIYNLHTEAAQKTQEYLLGINKIIAEKNIPLLVAEYLQAVQAINKFALSAETIKYYPGSPQLAKYFSRPHDRLVFCELHTETMFKLRDEFKEDENIHVHHKDAYHALKAFLPPLERRGCVLIDPPFEQRDEFNLLLTGLNTALTRWATGIYAIWYPIKNNQLHSAFLVNLKKIIQHELLCVELTIYPDDSPIALNGCGMVIINPPWQLDQTLLEVLPWLWQVLSINQQGHFKVELL